MTNITTLEQRVIDGINNVDEPNYFFTTCIRVNMDGKVMRGVLASLVKKGLIDINTEDGGLVSVLQPEYFAGVHQRIVANRAAGNYDNVY